MTAVSPAASPAGPLGVAVKGVVLDGEGRILVIQRSARDGEADLWELPGARLDHGEMLREALARALREATGLDASVGDACHVCRFTCGGMTCLTFVCAADGTKLALSDEHRGFAWISVAEIPDRKYSRSTREQLDGYARSVGSPLPSAESAAGPAARSSHAVDPGEDEEWALDQDERVWAWDQVAKFHRLRPTYEAFATGLAELLREIASANDMHVIVSARAKTMASFAEKIWRKRDDHDDPVNQFTDLCGARVITQTPQEVEAFSSLVEDAFEIDTDNSDDAAQRLRPNEFGYRSVHYIVKLRCAPGDAMYGLKAEIQVRTMLQHAWAVASHELSYKGGFDIPRQWKRKLAGVAAVLESADDAVQSIRDGLDRYASSFGAYMTPAEIRAEIARLDIGLRHDPGDCDLACRIAMLAAEIGEWEKAENAVKKLAPDLAGPVAIRERRVLRELGRARCELYSPDTGLFEEGQRCLERAADPPDRDVEALLLLARSWRKAGDDEEVRDVYRQAFEADQSNAYALGGYLEQRLAAGGEATVTAMRPQLEAAVEQCRDHAEVRVNVPTALFEKGRFELLLDFDDQRAARVGARRARRLMTLATGPQPAERYRALASYSRGVHLSPTAWPLKAALEALGRLKDHYGDRPDYEWVRRLLLLALATRIPGSPEEDGLVRAASEEVKALRTRDAEPITEPVVMVVGGSDASVAAKMADYQSLLVEAFEDFEGTIISGGTKEGVGGLVGDVRETHGEQVTAIGYVPRLMPPDAHQDDRYQIHWTDGAGFSPAEPLQGWIDVVASGIHPSQVKVIGINGGAITFCEFRLALGLGARVVTVKGSRREADALLFDPEWADVRLPDDGSAADGPLRLVEIPKQVETLRAYAHARALPPTRGTLPHGTRDKLAPLIHENYREQQRDKKPQSDAAMADWDDLAEGLRESNRQQADSYLAVLGAIGRGVRLPAHGVPLADPAALTDREVEWLAPAEHDRWTLEKIFGGWTWGETKVDEAKRHHLLVPWLKLDPNEEHEKDRDAVAKIPFNLATVGLEVFKNPDASGRRPG